MWDLVKGLSRWCGRMGGSLPLAVYYYSLRSPPVDTGVETQPGARTQTEETQPETQVDERDDEPVGHFQ